MKIPKLELLIIIDNAIITGLLFYISFPKWYYGLLCGGLTLIIQLGFYQALRKLFGHKLKAKKTS